MQEDNQSEIPSNTELGIPETEESIIAWEMTEEELQQIELDDEESE